MADIETSLINNLFLKTPGLAIRMLKFYDRLLFPIELHLFEKSLNSIASKYNLDREYLRAFLLEYQKEDLDPTWQNIINDFVIDLEINMYEDASLRPKIQAIRSIEYKNLLNDINKKISSNNIERTKALSMIDELNQIGIAESIFLLKSIVGNQDIDCINLYFNKLESQECSILTDDESYSRIMLNYLLEVLSDYERLDAAITSRIIKHFSLKFDYFENDLGFSNEKIFNKLSILMESSLFYFKSNYYSNSKYFATDLITKLLNIYNKIGFSSVEAMVGTMSYYIQFINSILRSISKRVLFHRFSEITSYRESDFRFCLNLLHSVLSLIKKSTNFIIKLKESIGVLNFKDNIRSIYIKLNMINLEYCNDENISTDKLVKWDVSSHIISILLNIIDINKELN